MKKLFFLYLFLSSGFLFAQDAEEAKFYIGLSYGTSFTLGDFKDTDIENPDAGFADNGQKFDIYGGYFLNDKITITGTFRYQSFNTDIDDLVNTFRENNPGIEFSGGTEDWQTYYFLVGIAYKLKITKKFNIFPRVGLGPLFVSNPGITINNISGAPIESFNRSSETGAGLGYEFGLGFRTDLGRRFSLMPTFTFSGGIVTINDVVSRTDNIAVSADYSPRIQSFNLGLSLAYRFY